MAALLLGLCRAHGSTLRAAWLGQQQSPDLSEAAVGSMPAQSDLDGWAMIVLDAQFQALQPAMTAVVLAAAVQEALHWSVCKNGVAGFAQVSTAQIGMQHQTGKLNLTRDERALLHWARHALHSIRASCLQQPFA